MPSTDTPRTMPGYFHRLRKLVLENRTLTTSNFIDRLADVFQDSLHAWAKERISAYKCPRYVVIVESLPMTISLKTRKVELRNVYENSVRRYGGHANRVLSRRDLEEGAPA